MTDFSADAGEDSYYDSANNDDILTCFGKREVK